MPNSFSHLKHGAVTDVGIKRKNNEDSIVTIPDHGVFCVADGMGGVQGGKIASQATITCLKNSFNSLSAPDVVAGVGNKAKLIDNALNRASRWIKTKADKKGIKGTGTTAVVIAFDGRDPCKAMILHAGDSRAYRYRGANLSQLSRDHTVANEAGVEDESQLPIMFKGVVTRAIGVSTKVELEYTPVNVQTDDIFLLSSDGLDKLLSDEDIAAFIRTGKGGDLQKLSEAMVKETNNRGGVDNVSIILIRVEEADPETLTDGTDADDLPHVGGQRRNLAASDESDVLDALDPDCVLVCDTPARDAGDAGDLITQPETRDVDRFPQVPEKSKIDSPAEARYGLKGKIVRVTIWGVALGLIAFLIWCFARFL